MSCISEKRIKTDIKKFILSQHERDGIFIHVDESNITKIKALIIGGQDTPYADGFHLFDINITKTYPYDPPKVAYKTGDGVTRFNPNLYTNGRVCLSILGTWSGPPWTPLFTFGSILLSIQSMILNKEPLTNEPGFENTEKKNIKLYNEFIKHQNLKVALLDQMETIPLGFDCFKDTMQKYILENKSRIRDRILQHVSTQNDKQINLQVAFSCKLTTDYKDILLRFDQLVASIQLENLVVV